MLHDPQIPQVDLIEFNMHLFFITDYMDLIEFNTHNIHK